MVNQVNSTSQSVHEIMRGFQQSTFHEKIAEKSADVFELLPRMYEPKFKNPCWFANEKLNCLPYFNILGKPSSTSRILVSFVDSDYKLTRSPFYQNIHLSTMNDTLTHQSPERQYKWTKLIVAWIAPAIVDPGMFDYVGQCIWDAASSKVPKESALNL